MNLIDIPKLIAQTEVTFEDVAQLLFNGNSYPALALKRICKGEGELTESQILKLADLLDCTIDDLYLQKAWKSKRDQQTITFRKDGKYLAVFNTVTHSIQLFENDKKIAEKIFTKKAITLSEVIQYLEEKTN